MAFDPEKVSSQTSDLEEQETRLTKQPERKELPGSDQEEIGGLKKKIEFLNKIRQSGRENEFFRDLISGEQSRVNKYPEFIEPRPDLKDEFDVQLTKEDGFEELKGDAAAHEFIDYLAEEAQQQIRRLEDSERQQPEKQETVPPEQGAGPTDYPDYSAEKREQEEGAQNQQPPGQTTQQDDSTGTAERDSDLETEREEKDKEQEEDGPDSEQMTDAEKQEEPQALKEARVKYLKGLRLRGKMVRGEYTAKLFEWSPWHDKRSVTIENENGEPEELFFGVREGEANLDRLRNRYERELANFREKKIEEFVSDLDNDLPESEREERISSFAVQLKTAEMEREEKAFERLDESFDDDSFRDMYRTDWFQKYRFGTSMGALGVGVATGGTAGAVALGVKGSMAGAGAAVAAEQGMERTHMRGYNPLSRTGAVADIQSSLDDDPDIGQISEAINAKFTDEDGSFDAERLKREISRIRMLANDMGTSLDQAVAGSDDVTAAIVDQMRDQANEFISDKSLDSIRGQIDSGEMTENEAVAEGLMDVLNSEQEDIRDEMENQNDRERNKKIARRLLAAAAGGSVGWFVGSGSMSRLINNASDWFGDWFDSETPPVAEGDTDEFTPEAPPESGSDTIFDVEIKDWDGPQTADDPTEARSFIEATGDIKQQMQNLDAFDVAGAEGSPLNNLEAAENLQAFLDGDIANNLAERLDGYQPEDIRESLVVHPGDQLSVTKEGNLILEQADGDTDLLYDGAQDKVNAEALKDDLFGDFDDVSGGEISGSETVESATETQDVSAESTLDTPEVEPIDPTTDVDIPETISMPETGEALERIRSRSQEANGILKGAMNSFVDAGGDPVYMDSAQLPDGMNQQEFSNHIQKLNQSQSPLANLHDVAESNPEQFRALQTLMDQYTEFHLDASSDMGVAETEDLKSLYTALDNYVDQGAPDLTASTETTAADAGPSLEDQLKQTPESIDAEAPEPPADESTGAEAESGATVEGEGRGADVEKSGDQENKVVTGEGRGAEVTTEQTQPEQSGAETTQANEQPAQGTDSIEVETGDDALDGAEQPSLQERLDAVDNVRNLEVTADEVNGLELTSDMTPEGYIGNEIAPTASVQPFENPALQNVSSGEWTNLTDTFKRAESFSDGVDRLLATDQTDQLKALFYALDAEQAGELRVGVDASSEDLKAMQAYINDQFETATGKPIPELDNNGEIVQQAAEAEPTAADIPESKFPELSAEPQEGQLLQSAIQEFSPGQVFSYDGSTYVFAEGSTEDQAISQARQALIDVTDKDTGISVQSVMSPISSESDQEVALLKIA
jgi:hypothetical protein